MRYLTGVEEQQALSWMRETLLVAQRSTCQRSKCGTIIVKNGTLIGTGYNSPPAHLETQRRCSREKKEYDAKVTDKTCCVHAEQRAIMDSLTNHSENIKGSTLYFLRLDAEGTPIRAGKPYCTHCSKLALDTGISEFILWHETGLCAYDAEEYNTLSYKYEKTNELC